MTLQETCLESKPFFHGTVINLRVDRVAIGDGSVRRREVVEHPGGVCVAALTSDDQILMVRQYRYAIGQVLLELPAGKLEPGEDPFEAACREQSEETGTQGTGYQSLGSMYATPGYDTERIYLWACRVCDHGVPHPDDGELIEPLSLPLSRAEEMVLNGEILDGKSQIAILKTAALVRQGLL